MKKTIGELCDELSIINCKIFHVMEVGGDLDTIKKLNRHRSDLKNAINSYFNERTEVKTYGK